MSNRDRNPIEARRTKRALTRNDVQKVVESAASSTTPAQPVEVPAGSLVQLPAVTLPAGGLNGQALELGMTGPWWLLEQTRQWVQVGHEQDVPSVPRGAVGGLSTIAFLNGQRVSFDGMGGVFSWDPASGLLTINVTGVYLATSAYMPYILLAGSVYRPAASGADRWTLLSILPEVFDA
jgi:hypothetical protein